MPVDTVAGDGRLRQFTAGEITAMGIETIDVRDRTHYVESRRVDENVMTRQFLCVWGERFNFISLVLGDVALFTDTGPVKKLSRQLPDSTFGRHPDSTQIVATRIDDMRAHNVGTDNGSQFPTSSKARVTVFYEQQPYAISSDAGLSTEKDRYTSRGQATTEAEAFTLPGGTFQYVESGGGGVTGTPVPFNISFTRPIRRFTMWWHMLPNELYIQNGALFDRLYKGVSGDGIGWIGTVNSAAVTWTSLGSYPAGTLLLEGVDDRSELSPLTATGLASLRWTVGLKFAYTPRGWLNLFYWDPATPSDSDYYEVTNDGTYYGPAAMPDHTGLYNVRDHNSLWDPNL